VPAADDLFRETGARQARGTDTTDTTDAEPLEAPQTTPRGTSGRVRHDEKMTVYVTSDELLELEHARLTLRSKHGVAVDRGRLVREAIAIALADLEADGEQSVLVRRLAAGD
jgi:hypothetical protein